MLISLWHPFRVEYSFSTLSGGLRYASTTGYYLPALRAVSPATTHCPLPAADCRLPTHAAHCPLPTAQYLLFLIQRYVLLESLAIGIVGLLL
jgi:hypothetical protein